MNDLYRKRPVTVHAWQLTKDDIDGLPGIPIAWPEWLAKAWHDGVLFLSDDGSLRIGTLEGTSYALSAGYWVVMGVEGEMWPVRDDVFTKTYEPVEG